MSRNNGFIVNLLAMGRHVRRVPMTGRLSRRLALPPSLLLCHAVREPRG